MALQNFIDNSLPTIKAAWLNFVDVLLNKPNTSFLIATQPNMDFITRDANLGVGAADGKIGMGAVSQSSAKSDANASTYATIGLAAFAWNDKTSVVTAAWGAYFEAKRAGSSVGPVYGVEIDATNNGTYVAAGPGGTYTNCSFGVWLAAGGDATVNPASSDSSAGVWFANNGAKWGKGIVYDYLSLRINAGLSWGQQVAMEMTAQNALQWVDNTGARFAYIGTTSFVAGDKSLGIGFGANYVVFSNTDDDAIQFQVSRVANATSHITAAGSAGNVPVLYADKGGSGNIDFDIMSQNTGSIKFRTGGYGSGNIQVVILDTPSATNYVTLKGSNGGNPQIGVSGGGLSVASDLYIAGAVEFPGPVTITADGAVSSTAYSVIANKAGTLTLTLPSAASYPGRLLRVKTITANTVVSASSNVVPLVGGAAGTAILAATAGKWADLQSDGTNWIIMAGN